MSSDRATNASEPLRPNRRPISPLPKGDGFADPKEETVKSLQGDILTDLRQRAKSFLTASWAYGRLQGSFYKVCR